ncbi:MAG TPA: hypothetical protein VF939_09320 [Puia sp.]
MKLLLFLLFPVIGFSQTGVEKVSLVDNKVTLLVPKGLSIMSAEMWKLKYQQRERPELVLTDEDGEVNLVGKRTQQPATDAQIASYTDFQLAQLRKSRSDMTVLGNGIKVVNGKKVGYIKFLSQAVDQPVFNYYFFVVVDGKILFFTFNCIEKLRKVWEMTADEIVDSLRIK